MATTNNVFLLDSEGANTLASLQVEETSPYKDSTATSYDVQNVQSVSRDYVTTYNVDSTIGQITGGASFPFASVVIDSSYVYEVADLSVTADLVATYSSRQPIDQQYTVGFSLLSGVESDLTETYSLGGYVIEDSPDFAYVVVGEVLKDLSPTYTVVGEVLADRAVTYEVLTTPLTATSLLYPVWDILESRTLDSEQTYTVFNDVSADHTGVFYVFTPVEKSTVDFTYDLDSSVDSTKVFTYNLEVFTGVSTDYSFSYSLESDIVVMPNVLGMPLSLATSTIQGTGLTVGTVTYVTLQ